MTKQLRGNTEALHHPKGEAAGLLASGLGELSGLTYLADGVSVDPVTAGKGEQVVGGAGARLHRPRVEKRPNMA